MEKVIENFLRYVKIDTQSDDAVETLPSTQKQHELASLLEGELKEMGASEVTYDKEHCYIYAVLPATKGKENLPAIGFLSHMDTSPAVSGKDVHPRIIENYDGKDICLDKEGKYCLSVGAYPELLEDKGKDLIVTDGTTLLGADDKAGIAEIMAMAEYLCTHPEIEHGKICIAFTPDEEVGRGVDEFNTAQFGAKYAYTVDGGALGELEYENFNAASAKISIHGVGIHPGDAKDKMQNAVLIAAEFLSMLPKAQTPEHTCGYEGFIHADEIKGDVEETTIDFIIRDHNRELFEEKKELVKEIGEFLNKKYKKDTVCVNINDSYYNMKEQILPAFHLIEHAKCAMELADVTPKIIPIRGGTDGARLSYMGIPCPNLFTGGHNFHSRYEYICIQSMEKMVEILLNLVKLYSK